MRTASGTDAISAALALASDGNKVFPLDGKILFRGTRGLKDASMTQQGASYGRGTLKPIYKA